MPVQYKDYYEVLGVPRSATEAQIKQAFRKLAREHHPDVAKDKKKAEEKARSETEEALNEFFAATKVTDDLIGEAAMEAEMRLCEIPAALKNHMKTLAIAMGKQRK